MVNPSGEPRLQGKIHLLLHSGRLDACIPGGSGKCRYSLYSIF
jgi:hypothetical protein